MSFVTLYLNEYTVFSVGFLLQQLSSLWHISVLNMDLHTENKKWLLFKI